MTFGDCVGTVAAAAVRHDTADELTLGRPCGGRQDGLAGKGALFLRHMEPRFCIQVTPTKQSCLRGRGPSRNFGGLHQVKIGSVSSPHPAREAAWALVFRASHLPAPEKKDEPEPWRGCHQGLRRVQVIKSMYSRGLRGRGTGAGATGWTQMPEMRNEDNWK